MIATAIALLIVLFVGIAFWIFNESLSHHFAAGFLSITRWILPERLRTERLIYIGYRIFFYAASLFCLVTVVLYTVLLISNIHNL
jgi:hypothetical protein